MVTAGLPFCGHCGGRSRRSPRPRTATSAARRTRKASTCSAADAAIASDSACRSSCSNGTQVIGAGRMARRSQARAARRLRRGRAELHARPRRGRRRPRRRRHHVRERSLHVAAARAPRDARRDSCGCATWARATALGVHRRADQADRRRSDARSDRSCCAFAGSAIRARIRRRPTRPAGWARPFPPSTSPCIEQLRADGSCRDVYHLSPGRTVAHRARNGRLGFPVRSNDERTARGNSIGGQRVLRRTTRTAATASRWRCAASAPLKTGQRLLVGDQILRVESV